MEFTNSLQVERFGKGEAQCGPIRIRAMLIGHVMDDDVTMYLVRTRIGLDGT
jgi:hypothetical protein